MTRSRIVFVFEKETIDEGVNEEVSPVSVAAGSVVFTGRPDDGDGLHFVEFGRSGTNSDQQTEENSENVLNPLNLQEKQ